MKFILRIFQYYIEHIIKNHDTVTDNPFKRINVSNTENKVIFNIKVVYYLELSMLKLFGSTEIKITGKKIKKNVPDTEITEVVFAHNELFNNNHQHDSPVLYSFISKKSFGQLLDILPKKFIFLKTFDLELSVVKIWFTDQNFQPLKMK